MVSTRRCIATGRVLPKSDLVRFVVGPDSTVVPDVAGKLPGRGLWVSPRSGALGRAVKRNLFARAARCPARIPEDLVALTEAALVRHLVGLIALARKGGGAVCGFEKVRLTLERAGDAILFQARDGSPAQRRKLGGPGRAADAISCLSGAELGLAFGREKVIHAALGAGGLGQAIVEQAAKLAGLRETGGSPPEKMGKVDV